jgi:hypothetical protein
MRKTIAWIATAFAALLFVLNWIGYVETIKDVLQHRGVLVSAAVTVLTSQWFALCIFLFGVFALALIQWGVPEWIKKRAPITIILFPRWDAPILATVINNDRDYPAHVKRSTLYGIKKRGHKERLHDASKFRTCLKPPYTIDPERRVEQAYGGYIPFESFKFLQAEIELENGKIFVSKKAKSPAPPRDKHKPIESVALESESVEEPESKFTIESGPKASVQIAQPKEPQPIIIAIDELKSLLYEGERLVGRFQEDSVKPTFPEIEDWRRRTRDCARQNVLATESLVGAKDLLRLEKPWDKGDLLRIAAKFVDHGCLRADD